MNIILTNDYLIKDYINSYTVGQIIRKDGEIVRSGDNEDSSIKLANQTYHATITDAFKAIQRYEIMKSEAATLEQLGRDIKQANDYIKSEFDRLIKGMEE
jgi:hypothetical protein